MEWQAPLLYQLRMEVPNIRYLGIDVVSSVIHSNRALFAGTEAWTSFTAAELSSYLLPRGYDLLLSRDALMHNTFESIAAILRSFALSQTRYFLLGSYVGGRNYRICTGGWFPIDLALPPFSLTPTRVFYEGSLESGPLEPVTTTTHAQLALYFYEHAQLVSMVERWPSTWSLTEYPPMARGYGGC